MVRSGVGRSERRDRDAYHKETFIFPRSAAIGWAVQLSQRIGHRVKLQPLTHPLPGGQTPQMTLGTGRTLPYSMTMSFKSSRTPSMCILAK